MIKTFFISVILLVLACNTHVDHKANIAVNQVGYIPQAPKFVFTNLNEKTFSVLDDSKQVVFNGKLSEGVYDTSTNAIVFTGDFSDLQTPGLYQVEIEDHLSLPFTIGDSIYHKLYVDAFRTFYLSRCGVDLDPKLAGGFAHTKCHMDDGYFHPSSGFEGRKDVTGGWHDAGDYGKYIVNAGVTVGTMLMAYEWFPDYFADDDLNIPESGNGIPDLLDELKFEIEWMLTMQDNSGGAYHKCTRELFEPFVMPEEDDGKRYIYTITTSATSQFCATTALASRIFKTIDPAFSKTCWRASKKAWDFLDKNPDTFPKGGYRNPEGTHTGTYCSPRSQHFRYWAAAELFINTKDKKFFNILAENMDKTKFRIEDLNWGASEYLIHWTSMKHIDKFPKGEFKSFIYSELRKACEFGLEIKKNSGYNRMLFTTDYHWGCAHMPLNQAIVMLIGHQVFGNPEYLTTSVDQMNWVLGANGLSQSYVSGFGEKSPLHPHNRHCHSDSVEKPIPGFMVGGPNRKLEDAVMKEAFTKNIPPALCYVDDWESYSTNETAINWNAPLVWVAGFLNGIASEYDQYQERSTSEK